MIRITQITFALGLTLANASFVTGQAILDELPPAIKRFVAEDTIAIGHLDLQDLDVESVSRWMEATGFLDEADTTRLVGITTQLGRGIEQIEQSGVHHAYVFLSLENLLQQQPTIVFSVDAKQPNGDFKETLQEIAKKYWKPAPIVAVQNQFVIVAGSESQLSKFLSIAPAQRPEARAAWQTIKSERLGVALLGDKASRRVIRDMLPPLPAPFEAITGRLVADELVWATLAGDLPPSLTAKLVVQTANEATANTLVKSVSAGIDLLAELPTSDEDKVLVETLRELLSAASPVAVGKRMEFDLKDQLSDAGRIRKLLAGPLKAAQIRAADMEQTNKLRQLTLALLNYESANRHFPAYASFDGEKPLLSWRVHVLPYLGEVDLWKKFRLDEPWDSEHNLKLVKEIPHAFRDKRSHAINEQGKTRYQCPQGPGFFFDGNNEAKISDFQDGTSRTVSVLIVNPDRAVTWTKPGDWTVDRDDPWSGVRPVQASEKLFASFVDSSAHRFSRTMDRKVLLSILTRDGGEPIDNEDLQ